MLPDPPESMSILEVELRTAIKSWREDAHIELVAEAQLQRFAYAPAEQQSTNSSPSTFRRSVRALQVKPSPLGKWTARHYLLGAVVTQRLSEPHFIEALRAAAHLRSHLAGSEQLEVTVVLVAPRGCADDPSWQGAARRMEQNDSYARLLVWKPPEAPNEAKDSAQDFMHRLHLTPLPAAPPGETRLSPTQVILADAEVAEKTRVAWGRILTSTSITAKQRATELVAALERPRGS